MHVHGNFSSTVSSVFPVEDSAGVNSNSKPQNWAPNFSPISYRIFPQIFRDGRTPEGLPSPTKRSPKTAFVFLRREAGSSSASSSLASLSSGVRSTSPPSTIAFEDPQAPTPLMQAWQPDHEHQMPSINFPSFHHLHHRIGCSRGQEDWGVDSFYEGHHMLVRCWLFADFLAADFSILILICIFYLFCSF